MGNGCLDEFFWASGVDVIRMHSRGLGVPAGGERYSVLGRMFSRGGSCNLFRFWHNELSAPETRDKGFQAQVMGKPITGTSGTLAISGQIMGTISNWKLRPDQEKFDQSLMGIPVVVNPYMRPGEFALVGNGVSQPAGIMGHVPPSLPARRPPTVFSPIVAQSNRVTLDNLRAVEAMQRLAMISGEPISVVQDAVRSLTRTTTMSAMEASEAMTEEIQANQRPGGLARPGTFPPTAKPVAPSQSLPKPTKRKIILE